MQWRRTWKYSDVAARLKWVAVFEPGDESGGVGLDLTQQRGGTADSDCHLLSGTVRAWSSNGGRNWKQKEGKYTCLRVNSARPTFISVSFSISFISNAKVTKQFFGFIPRTLRLKCRLRSPALLDARQLYLPVSATWAPEIWRKRPWDKTWWRRSGTSRWPSFSHLMSGTGLPWKFTNWA